MLKEKNWSNFQRMLELFTKKLSPSCQKKYGFGIRDPEKTHSGSRGQKGTGSRIRIRKTAQIVFVSILCAFSRPGTDRPAQVQMQRDPGFREEHWEVCSI
jgi:hypothetical protein